MKLSIALSATMLDAATKNKLLAAFSKNDISAEGGKREIEETVKQATANFDKIWNALFNGDTSFIDAEYFIARLAAQVNKQREFPISIYTPQRIAANLLFYSLLGGSPHIGTFSIERAKLVEQYIPKSLPAFYTVELKELPYFLEIRRTPLKPVKVWLEYNTKTQRRMDNGMLKLLEGKHLIVPQLVPLAPRVEAKPTPVAPRVEAKPTPVAPRVEAKPTPTPPKVEPPKPTPVAPRVKAKPLDDATKTKVAKVLAEVAEMIQFEDAAEWTKVCNVAEWLYGHGDLHFNTKSMSIEEATIEAHRIIIGYNMVVNDLIVKEPVAVCSLMAIVGLVSPFLRNFDACVYAGFENFSPEIYKLLEDVLPKHLSTNFVWTNLLSATDKEHSKKVIEQRKAAAPTPPKVEPPKPAAPKVEPPKPTPPKPAAPTPPKVEPPKPTPPKPAAPKVEPPKPTPPKPAAPRVEPPKPTVSPVTVVPTPVATVHTKLEQKQLVALGKELATILKKHRVSGDAGSCTAAASGVVNGNDVYFGKGRIAMAQVVSLFGPRSPQLAAHCFLYVVGNDKVSVATVKKYPVALLNEVSAALPTPHPDNF